MPYFEEGNANMVQLEAMIDATSVRVVLDAITSICHGKAQHIRDNWQDRATAAPWNQAGNVVDACASKLTKIGV